MFAPDFTTRRRTSMVASEVVTRPVTTVDGSPALNVSTVSAFHGTPRLFRMRSTTSCDVGAAAPCAAGSSRNGEATAPTVLSLTNARRDSHFIAAAGRVTLLQIGRAHV